MLRLAARTQAAAASRTGRQTEEQSKSVAKDATTAEAVRDELADVLLYLVRLSSVLGVHLNEAVTQKLVKNGNKYPAGDSTPSRH